MAINATAFPYDLGIVTAGNNTNILTFIQGVNDMTGQWFMIGMLLAGFVIMFVSMMEHGNKEALLTAGFIISIMSIFFMSLGFISTGKLITILVVFVLVFAVSTQIKS